jgi:hypothetical protein
VDVDAGLAVAVGGGVAVPIEPCERGVRVGVGVGAGVRPGQPASAASMTAPAAAERTTRQINRIFVFLTMGSLIVLFPVFIPKGYPNSVWDIAWVIARPIAKHELCT